MDYIRVPMRLSTKALNICSEAAGRTGPRVEAMDFAVDSDQTMVMEPKSWARNAKIKPSRSETKKSIRLRIPVKLMIVSMGMIPPDNVIGGVAATIQCGLDKSVLFVEPDRGLVRGGYVERRALEAP